MLAVAILSKAKSYAGSKSLQHVAILLSGRVAVQLIALISQILLARVYTPEQFGEFALLNSILAILLIASSGRYEAGIVITKRPLHSQRLFQLSQVLLAVTVCLICILLALSSPLLKLWSTHTGFSLTYIWLLPLLVACSGYWQIVQNWLIRFRSYKKFSIALICQRLTILSGALLFYTLPLNHNGLIYGLVLGSVCMFCIALFYQRQSFYIPLKSLRSFAYHFKDFPGFSLPSLLLGLFIQHLPIFWIGYFYGTDLTGSYSMAYSIIMLPLTALSMSAGQIFAERLAHTPVPSRPQLVFKVCKYYGLILFPYAAILWMGGDELLGFILGEGWEEAGTIAAFLSPITFCQGITACFGISLTVHRKQVLVLTFQALKLFLLGTVLITDFYTNDIFLTLRLIGIFSIFHMLITGLLYYRTIFYNMHKYQKKPILVQL
ncbi:lipopolysaccharide biosynthesis protein [Cesiribacter andamanensis]|uniref:Colanic acid exporter n=1 Tax=Cesiribacter andamanensis AMV16 TaxID=1279009 RepID=M7NYX4_9BACT|nr:oligosaccharide flippase family protein [Cesiribacter andamanensis]EMR03574.1 colanic acid exporter [Cesiribacter andamanensis AMV16]